MLFEGKMTKLLLNEYPLVILPSLASTVGLNEAVILQQVHYWLIKSKHLKDGKRWVFNSYPEWKIQFPFFSTRQIQYAIKNLEKLKILITGNYNKLGMDRTKWYSIDYLVLDEICPSNKFVQSSDKIVQTIDNIVLTSDTIVPPLPETTTENTPETTTDNRETLFNTFWNLYDKKVNRNYCLKLFERLTNQDIDLILSTLPEYIKATPDKVYRKTPSTYLNNKSWTDEIIIMESKNVSGNNRSAGRNHDYKQPQNSKYNYQ